MDNPHSSLLELLAFDPTVQIDRSDTEVSLEQIGFESDVSNATQVIEVDAQSPISLYKATGQLGGKYYDESPDTTVYRGGVAERGFTQIRLSWIELSVPMQHDYTQVLRSTTDDPAGAKLVGESRTQAFVDTVEPSQDYYYFLRGVTYVGNTGELSEAYSAAKSSEQSEVLEFLGLDKVLDELNRLEGRITSTTNVTRLMLDELAAQNLSEALTLINDTFNTVFDNLVQIEQNVGLTNYESIANLREQITAVLDDSTARIETINELTAELNSERAERESEITRIDSALVTTDKAITSVREDLESKILDESSDRSAAIESERQLTITREQVIADSVETLSSQMKSDLGKTNAELETERQTRLTAQAALAQEVTDIRSGFDSAKGTINSRITDEVRTLSNAQEALASSFTELNSKYIADQATTVADISQRFDTFTNEFEAYAESVLNLEADNGDTAAALEQEAIARADGDQANAQAITDLSAQMNTDIGISLAEAKDYTNATVGYCVIGGEVSSDTDRDSCVSSGGEWLRLPLSEAIDQVSVSYTGYDGKSAKGTVGSALTAFANKLGEVETRAFFGTNVDGEITGLVATDSSGNKVNRKLKLVGSQVEILNEETKVPFISWDTENKVGVVRGKLILSDGTTINGVDDLGSAESGEQGPAGPEGPQGPQGEKGDTGAAGEDGEDGRIGPGFYAITNSDGNFPSNATATSNFISTFGFSPAVNDHLTYVNSARTNSTIKRYTGSGWSPPLLAVNGDILVKGVVTAEHIASQAVTTSKLSAGAVTTDKLTTKAVKASKIDVDDLFAQNINATGTITGLKLVGAELEVVSNESSKRVNITASGDSPIIVSDGSKNVLSFNSQNKLILDAGLGPGTISSPSVFTSAMWSQIRAQTSDTSLGGTFYGDEKTGDSSTTSLTSEIIVDGASGADAQVSFRFHDQHSTRDAPYAVWKATITSWTKNLSTGSWENQSTYATAQFSSRRDSMFVAVTSADYSKDKAVNGATKGGIFRVRVTLSLIDGIASNPKLTDVVLIQDVIGGSGGGTATGGNADTLQNQTGAYYLNFNNFAGTIKSSSLPQKLRDFDNELVTGQNQFTGNNIFKNDIFIQTDARVEGKLTIISPTNSSSVMQFYGHDENWVKARFGGTSELDGISFSNYDNDAVRIYRKGQIDIHGSAPHLRFAPDDSNDFGGIRYTAGSGNDGEMEFWTSDDYSEPFVWRSYDTGSEGEGANRTWMKLSDNGLAVKKVYMGTVSVAQDPDHNQLRIANTNGYVSVGCYNSSYAHILTDRGKFYMGSDVHVNGALEIYGSGTKLYSESFNMKGKQVLRGNDSWLRLNEKSWFTSGIYTGSSLVRSDNALLVGAGGGTFKADSSGVYTKGNRLFESIYAHGYHGMAIGGSNSTWIRTTTNGIIPYQSGGYSSLGTTGWPFNEVNVKKLKCWGYMDIRSGNSESNLNLIGSNGRYGRMWYRTSDYNFGFYLYGSDGSVSTRLRWNGNNNRWTFQGESWAKDHVATSDRRVKENIVAIPNALKSVNRLSGYTYWHKQLEGRKAGLIAQELEEVLPESVSEDEEGIKNVSLSGPVALLVEAVKELTKKVEHLEEKLYG